MHSMAFEPPAPMEEPLAPESVYLNYAERFWPPAIAFIVMGVVLTTFVRGRGAAQAARASMQGVLASSQGRTVQEMERALGGGGFGGARNQDTLGQDAGIFGYVPAGIVPKLSTPLEPKIAAQVIKGWLNEG